MASPVPLRSDFDAEGLRALAKLSRDPAQIRRLLALSAIYAGGARSEAAALGGVGPQTVRDWVVAFNAHGPDRLIDGKAPGARPRLNAEQWAALRSLVEEGPIPAAHGVLRWRLVGLAQFLFEDHGVSVSEQTLSRVLRCMATANSRPARATTPRTRTPSPLSKSFPRPRGRDPAGRRRQADRGLVHRRGSRRAEEHDHPAVGRAWYAPRGPKDQRAASASIFGAICPALGKGASLVMPRCTTEAMVLHLEEVAQAVAPGAHAVLLLDQARWHTTRELAVPANITLLPLPARAPELNPVENLWQFMRDNWLGDRVFAA